ncbi:Hsp70 family protein [Microbacterium sp. dk485]|nr:Hsp70 family protein [Microbacterium sp. dk485]
MPARRRMRHLLPSPGRRPPFPSMRACATIQHTSMRWGHASAIGTSVGMSLGFPLLAYGTSAGAPRGSFVRGEEMNGPYYLAIDVGTSRTSAAIARFAPDGSLLATPFPLGRSGDNAPTVVFAADGELLFGDAAERRGHTQPDRLIREYKRRIGDDVPILAADRAFAPEELYARTVDWAARAVVEREGGSPALLAITVPAAWGEYRSDIVRTALSEQGWRGVVVITEPEAAARHYESTNPLPEGRVLAVYDFGGGTFDAVALRKDADGAVRIVGAPAGIPDLGGADFDDALVRHVVRTARLDTMALAGDTSGRMALAALRRECVDAKESLSFDSEAVVPVLLSGDQRSVRLSRDEFEVMIADDLDRTVDAFEDALERAGVDLDDVDAILLTGGTSRIPRVAQVLSERFDRPIALDADPKAIIALGAARAAADAARAAAEPADDVPALVVEDDAPALRPEPAAGAARRSWFRRAPVAAYLTVGAAVVLASLGVAGAPTLGTAIVGASDRADMTAAPEAAAADAGPGDHSAAQPAESAVEPVAEAEGARPEGTTWRRTPAKKPASATPPRTPGSSTRAAAQGRAAQGTTPAGGSAATPRPSSGSPSGSTPAPTPGGGDATPDPGPTDPGPSDPGPTDPGPADPGPANPGPADPGPTDPGPSDPGGTGGGDTGGGDTGGGDTAETPPADPPAEADPTPPPGGEPSPTPTAGVPV